MTIERDDGTEEVPPDWSEADQGHDIDPLDAPPPPRPASGGIAPTATLRSAGLHESHARPGWGPLAVAGTVAGTAGVVGLILGRLGAMVGPLGVVALPVGGIALYVVLRDPRYAFVGVFLVLPIGTVDVPGPFPLQLIEAVTLAAAFVVAIRQISIGESPLLIPRPMRWALLFLVVTVVATPASPDQSIAIKQCALLAGAVVLALLGPTVTQRFSDVRMFVNVFLVIAGGLCVYSLRTAVQLRSAFGGNIVDNRATVGGIFTHPNQLGVVAGAVFIVALGSLLGSSARRSRVVAYMAMVGSFLALLLSLSRGAWIGVAVALGFMAWLLPRFRTMLIWALVAAFFTAIVISTASPDNAQVRIVSQRVESFTRPTDNPYERRPAIYREAFRQISSDPWWGGGPGQFPVYAARAASQATTITPDHAHNVILSVTAEFGLIGLVCALGFTLAMVTAVRATIRALCSSSEKAVSVGLGAALCVAVGQGLVDFVFRNSVVTLVFASLVGLVLSAARASERDLRRVRKRRVPVLGTSR